MTEPGFTTTEEGAAIIYHYVAAQVALGNWPPDDIGEGPEVLFALVDTYEAVAG